VGDIQFLNIDLVLESREGLDPILEDFENEVVLMYQTQSRGLHRAAVELARIDGDADTTMNWLCNLVENLEPEARAAWESCLSRVFDIGYVSGDTPRALKPSCVPGPLPASRPSTAR
jgi:hypothetical protein